MDFLRTRMCRRRDRPRCSRLILRWKADGSSCSWGVWIPGRKGLDLLIEAYAQAGLGETALVLVGPDWFGSQKTLSGLAERLGISSQPRLHRTGVRGRASQSLRQRRRVRAPLAMGGLVAVGAGGRGRRQAMPDHPRRGSVRRARARAGRDPGGRQHREHRRWIETRGRPGARRASVDGRTCPACDDGPFQLAGNRYQTRGGLSERAGAKPAVVFSERNPGERRSASQIGERAPATIRPRRAMVSLLISTTLRPRPRWSARWLRSSESASHPRLRFVDVTGRPPD